MLTHHNIQHNICSGYCWVFVVEDTMLWGEQPKNKLCIQPCFNNVHTETSRNREQILKDLNLLNHFSSGRKVLLVSKQLLAGIIPRLKRKCRRLALHWCQTMKWSWHQLPVLPQHTPILTECVLRRQIYIHMYIKYKPNWLEMSPKKDKCS